MSAAGEQRQGGDQFVGRVVDERFEVQALVGSGAVGSVYKALDRRERRLVALKIWNASVLDAQTRGRFQREAMALTTLRHPNIVDVIGYGVLDDLPYVAMEFLDGQSVEDLLAGRQPLETALAFDIAQQMLAALAYAHGLGVVHRDLKPENILVTNARPAGGADPAGAKPVRVVKLLDYGLAKFLSPEADPVKGSLTLLGMVMGTPLYMAPEQAAGRAIDARVDVYAAGCVLFEMLSGQPPYLGETNGEVLRAHMLAPIPRLSDFRRDVVIAPALEAVIQKALAKQPQDRYADAGQMQQALIALPRPVSRRPSEQVPLAAPDPPPASPRFELSERVPLIAALITGLLTALVLAYALLQ